MKLLLYLFAFSIVLSVQGLFTQETRPKKNYVDSVTFENAPKRVNELFPLSDQGNTNSWKYLTSMSDEFEASKLDTEKWHPNNPGWKGRQPTYFHGSNVSLQDGELVFRINQHKDEKLPEGYTHSAGFIKSKRRILYGYLEAEQKLMDAPWVSGFWASYSDKAWWTEIDICENAPSENYQEYDLNSNIHVFKAPKDKGNVTEHFARNKKYHVPFRLHDDYHVWGLEWTKEYIRFYLDGVLFREAENTHWHQPLQININNESNKWFGALPDDNCLDGEFHVKYFRAWANDETQVID